MYIETVPNRGSPPAILLRESYRDGGRIRKRTLLNLSHWLAEHVEGLRGVLKGGVVLPPGEQPFVVERSLPHGAVAAVLGATRAIGLGTIIGPNEDTTDYPFPRRSDFGGDHPQAASLRGMSPGCDQRAHSARRAVAAGRAARRQPIPHSVSLDGLVWELGHRRGGRG